MEPVQTQVETESVDASEAPPPIPPAVPAAVAAVRTIQDLEIPYPDERSLRYRLFEMLPGFLSWTTIFLPFLLSMLNPVWGAYFIIGFILVWFVKAMAMAFRVFQGYGRMKHAESLNWQQLLNEVDEADASLARLSASPNKLLKQHYRNVVRYRSDEQVKLKSTDIIQLVIIAVYNESIEVIEPTVRAVLNATYDHQRQTILIIAYEERGGPDIEATSQQMIAQYGPQFLHAEAIKHPNGMVREVKGKGGNITYAMRQFMGWIDEHKIDYSRVLVTTLDSDNRPHPAYFAALTYTYLISEQRERKSFQPIPMYLNNIWDAPAAMRVVATGNSFWNVVLSVRPHLIRNFSAHAQPLTGLLHTDFWSVRTVVEDGHQFWRSYFAFDGNYDVIPLYIPIYQDAVLASTYLRTLKAQFIQVRRWAYGASDIPYVAEKGFFTKNKVPRFDLFMKFGRLIESHWSWATASLLIAFAAWAPMLLAPDSEAVVVHNLPNIVSRIQTIAMVGIIVNMYLSLKSLPPKPERYRKTRGFWMVVQWAWLPVTTIVYSTLAALNSQTRLFFGWYLNKFDVTEKAVKK